MTQMKKQPYWKNILYHVYYFITKVEIDTKLLHTNVL